MASTEQILKDKSRVFGEYDPVTIQASITDFCLNKCFMCDHHLRKDKSHIDGATWIKFLNSLKETKTIFYTGGDSILHPSINDIMKEHIKLNIDFGFISTGYIPKSVDLKLLSNAKFFNVSIDSLNQHNYEKIRGGIFLGDVIKSIDNALVNNIKVNATVIVSDKNIDEVINIIEFCYTRGMNLRLNTLYNKKQLAIEGLSKWVVEFTKKDLMLSYFSAKAYFEKCVVPYYSMFVDSIGDVYPCCVLAGDTEKNSNIKPLGNIKNFEKAKSKRLKFYNKTLNEKCKNCLGSFCKINNVFYTKNKANESIESDYCESRNFY